MSFVISLVYLGVLIWVVRQMAPLRKRLETLEARLAQLERGPKAAPGAPIANPATDVASAASTWTATAAPETPPEPTVHVVEPAAPVDLAVDPTTDPAQAGGRTESVTTVAPETFDGGWVPSPRSETASRPAAAKRPAPEPMNLIPKAVTTWLARWNPVVLGGAALVILGVIFLLGLAAQNGFFPPSLRLAFAAVLAGVLLVAGWKQRILRPTWALPLQGTAAAILFFVLYSASQQQHLIPTMAGFAGAVLVLLGTAVLAVLQSSQRLAVLALAAGFLAPVLFSSGNGSHIGLFSYYVVLDLGVVVMVALRGWKTLLGLAFVCTYGIATTWGVLKFEPQHAASCEVFLWIFYALFSGAALAFALRAREGQGAVVGSLVFALPSVTFGLQSKLVDGNALLLAWTAAGMALHHLIAGAWVLREVRSGRRPGLAVMTETLLVLGTLLASVAVPLAFSGRWTSLTWAVEGAGLVWLCTRQNRLWHLILGSLLMVGACITHVGADGVQVIDALVLVLALLSVSRSLISPTLPAKLPRGVALLVVLGAWGFAVRMLVVVLRDGEYGLDETFLAVGGLVLAGLMSLWARVPRLGWNGGHVAWVPAVALWLPLAVFYGGDAQGWDYLLWLTSALGALAVLDVARRDGLPMFVVRAVLESALVQALVWVALRAARNASPFGEDWTVAFQFVVAALLLGSFVHPRWANAVPWAKIRPESRRLPWLAPWAVFVALFAVFSPFGPSTGGLLPWLPFLNSLDLPAFAIWLVLLTLPAASLPLEPLRSRETLRRVFAAWVLVWMLATAARAFHHLADVPWDFDSLWDHRPLQATWSLLITAQALGMCWWASRRGLRPLWTLGAALLLVVTAKLLVVDLSGSGSVARIVSFLGAGLLMVGIGYLSPIPPASLDAAKSAQPVDGVVPPPAPKSVDFTGDAS